MSILLVLVTDLNFATNEVTIREFISEPDLGASDWGGRQRRKL